MNRPPAGLSNCFCRLRRHLLLSFFAFFVATGAMIAGALAQNVPKPAVDLQPMKASYQVKIEVGGQTISLSVTAEIKEENGTWVATELAKTAQGEVSDKTVIEKGSLILLKRSIKQGSVFDIDVEFKDKKATGAMTASGQSRPIAADTGGVMFADGAGTYFVIATLPLAEGYTTTFRNFDLQKQKDSVKQLKVIGTEKVTVPAGTFEAFKIEITSAEGDAGKTTVWIAKSSRKHLKTTASSPQMNGAVITSELLN